MALDLRDMSFAGAALPEPFVKLELEDVLAKWKLLRRPSAAEARALEAVWEPYRRKLRVLAETGAATRVASHVLDPLKAPLGYSTFVREEDVRTREGDEDGGWLFRTADGAAVLRAWSVELGADLDAPSMRGRAYRFSSARIAERVLLAKGERVGILTDGTELRVILCDPARTGSHIAVRLDKAGGWRGAKTVPDSFRLVQALCAPAGVARIAELVDLARLSQSRVTKTLREQAQAAVLSFVQSLLDDSRNAEKLSPLRRDDPGALAATLWREALVVIYRLLFILRLESTSDPARAFSFASTSLWRNTYSPNVALAPFVRKRIDHGVETGALLGDGLRALFQLFERGLTASELRVVPLGGMLFGEGTTPTLDGLAWGEDAVAHLLDRLLWTPRGRSAERQRVHYGALEVEDLGRVYEGLLEKEPGLATEPMCRLRRQKLEVVIPLAQGERYRPVSAVSSATGEADDEGSTDEGDDEDDEASTKKAKVVWVEAIAAGRFYLRTGLGRKATGSYYTPDAFVRFLVEKTLGPQVQARSPVNEPDPGAILTLKVLDPAMGSGHFLVGACRYLAEKLYEACRLCDEKAAQHRHHAENSRDDEARAAHESSARDLLARVEALPDPNDELMAWLPSRVGDGEGGGALAQSKALALCRRLVAVHCLYGVDKNPLAVELAKLALWLESYAEGLPLTFMDHRLLCGDSLAGPFLEDLATLPGRGEKMADDLFDKLGVPMLIRRVAEALAHVKALEASVGKDVAEVFEKRAAKRRLDESLAPLRLLAQVWSGGVMLGPTSCDDAGYAQLVAVMGIEGSEGAASIDDLIEGNERLRQMRDVGSGAVAYELTFPEVFWPKGYTGARQGFDAVLGNPPWEVLEISTVEVLSTFDPSITKSQSGNLERNADQLILEYPIIGKVIVAAHRNLEQVRRIARRLLDPTDVGTGKQDTYALFSVRSAALAGSSGSVGVLLPASFHINDSGILARNALLYQMGVRFLFSFDNKGRVFEDLPEVVRFDVVVCFSDRISGSFVAAFGLADPEKLFDPNAGFQYPYDLLPASPASGIIGFDSQHSLDCISVIWKHPSFAVSALSSGIDLTKEVNQTTVPAALVRLRKLKDYSVPDPRSARELARYVSDGMLVLYEGKCIGWHDPLYADTVGSKWDPIPTLAFSLEKGAEFAPGLTDRILDRARYFRFAIRESVGNHVTADRSVAATLVPPGTSCLDTGMVETTPSLRPYARALCLVAIVNTYVFDFVARCRIRAHLSKGILSSLPVPSLSQGAKLFLAHGALRLNAAHSGYLALWVEQIGETWREPARSKYEWPAVADNDARWQVRAAIDAVVAEAYGLTRAQYEHVLGGFGHKSYARASALCLAMFDELTALGVDAFAVKHDPYADIALVEALPRPVIDLGGANASKTAGPQMELAGLGGGDGVEAPKTKRGRKKG